MKNAFARLIGALTLIFGCSMTAKIATAVAADTQPTSTKTSPGSANAKELEVIRKFMALVHAGKKEEAAKMIRYPLHRPEPLEAIKSREEFVRDFGQFFDRDVLKQVEAKKSDVMSSWRGTSIAGGAVYADGGEITALNTSTPLMQKEVEQARKNQKAKIHPSVRDYTLLRFECVTDRHHVQVQETGGKIRYVSWAPGNLMKKPELLLPDGEMQVQGSGGGAIYKFKGGDFVYQVDQVGVCGEDCNSYLRVIRGKQELTKQKCQAQ